MLSLAVALSTAALLQFPEPLQRPVFLVKNLRVETGSAPAKDGISLLVRDGRIEAIGADLTAPADAEVIDGSTWTAVPAFIDAWSARLQPDASAGAAGGDAGARFRGARPSAASQAPQAPQAPVDEGVAVVAMDQVKRPGVNPAERASDKIAFDAEKLKALHECGFGLALAAPSGSMLAGRSALVALADEWTPAALLKDDVAEHISFRPPSDGDYPSTLMGVFAEVRQTFSDARWQETAWKRFDSHDGKAMRPPFDARLAALEPVRTGKQPLVFEADSALDINAALDLAKELGVKPVIAGGAEAFRVADRLKREDVPVLLAIDFPDAPKGLKKKDEKKDAKKPATVPVAEKHEAAKSDDAVAVAAKPDDSAKPAESGAAGAAGAADVTDATKAAPAAPQVAPKPADEQGEHAEEGRGQRRRRGGGDANAKPDAPDAGKPDGKPDAKSDEPTLPQRVLEEQDQRRNEKIANAKALSAAGVRFAFSTRGLKSIPQFRENLALAVDAGLDRDAALRALTCDAGTILGASDRVGGLEPGRAATFALFDGDPLKKDTHVRLLCVDGHRFPFQPPAKNDKADKGEKGDKSGAKEAAAGNAGGTWQAEVDLGGGKREYTIELTQDGATLSGNARSPSGTGEVSAGSVNGSTATFTVVFQFGARRYEFTYEGEVSGDTMSGNCTIKSPEGGAGEPHPFTATRSSQPHSDDDEADEVGGDQP